MMEEPGETEGEPWDPLTEARIAVEEVVTACLNASAAQTDTTQSLPIEPMLLIQNAAVLCKATVFEDVMQARIKRADGAEATRIAQVEAFLRGFIMQERKHRARVKLKYMLAAAHSGQLEEAISRLSIHSELDSTLMSTLEALLEKVQAQEMPSALRSSASEDILDEKDEADDMETLEIAERLREGVTAGRVLAALHERLQVETHSVHWSIRLLGALIGMTPDERLLHVLKTLKRIEDIDEFLEIINETLDHVRKGGVGRRKEGAATVKLSPEHYEILREIRDIVGIYKCTLGSSDGSQGGL
jgi:hypothetical protein